MQMKHITSRDNPLFKALRKLADSGRERRKSGQTLLDGVHLIEAFMAQGAVPEVLVMDAAAVPGDEARSLLARVPESRQVHLAPELFREISPVESPTGLLALIPIPKPAMPKALDLCLFVEDLRDPGNLGAVLRSAAAAGVQAAYLSTGCADVWSPKVLRGGMGAHFSLALIDHADLLRDMNAFDGQVVALCLGAEKSLYELDLRGRTGFVVGNEGAGLSQAVREAATVRASIPMPGRVESLNAAAAAAVCLFEAVRQRSFFPERT
jgi:TrmH family RNA methyltransferase